MTGTFQIEPLAAENVVTNTPPLPGPVLDSESEDDLESLALGSNPRFLAVIEPARTQCRQGLGLSSEAVRRELGLP